MVWNGYPYIVPLRRLRAHQPLAAWVHSHEHQHPTSSPAVYLITDHISMLDIVEGTVPFKPQLVGTIIGSDGRQRPSSSMTEPPPKIYEVAQRCAMDEWGIKIDGIVYGRCVRRLPTITGASFGRLVVWDCTKRSQYVMTDINPSRQSPDILPLIAGMADVKTPPVSESSLSRSRKKKKLPF